MTLVFAAYAVGVIVTLLVAGNYSDEAGRRPYCCTRWGCRR